MSKIYSLPVRVTFGVGALQKLPELACVHSARRIAFFTTPSQRKNGVVSQAEALLKEKEIRFIEDIGAQPEVVDVLRHAEDLRKHPCDCIVALGGGSVMDTAKVAAFCSGLEGDVLSLLSNPPAESKHPPIVAIPTTAGTGSEVTPFAVVWDTPHKKKYSLHHDRIYPDDALVDPVLTYSAPPGVTAASGMDAFTQACEAYWNRNHQPMSDAYALTAVRAIFPVLARTVADGLDAEARHDVMFGSLQGGMAFSNTRTAACHSISYPMTLHWGVTHGQAVGITLPEVLLLNADVMPDRVEAFCAALGVQTMRDAAEVIRKMMQQSGLQTRLSDLGIPAEGIDVIVREGFTPERMGNNPYVFNAETLKQMLTRIL